MEPSTYAVCQAAKWLKSSVERLSGKSLCEPNGAIFGSAKRPRRCHFATFCRLKGPRNGARSDFPGSLWKGYSPKFTGTAF